MGELIQRWTPGSTSTELSVPLPQLALVGKSFGPLSTCGDMDQYGQRSKALFAPEVPACRQRKQLGQCYVGPPVQGKGDRQCFSLVLCPQRSNSVAWKIHTHTWKPWFYQAGSAFSVWNPPNSQALSHQTEVITRKSKPTSTLPACPNPLLFSLISQIESGITKKFSFLPILQITHKTLLTAA